MEARAPPAVAGTGRGLAAALDELDPVAVGVADEGDERAAGPYLVRRALRLDPVLVLQPRERGVDVVDGDRDVPVSGAELVGVDAEVVGQLELRLRFPGNAEEVVDGLVPDRQLAAREVLREGELNETTYQFEFGERDEVF